MVIALAGCGSSPSPLPAPLQDAAPTGDGPCGTDDLYTGELVDWDSTDAAFCGVMAATFAVEGDASRTDSSNPNGRFQLCLAQADQTVVDVAPPTGPSQCAPTVGLYTMPGKAIARHDVIATGKLVSMRAIGATRAMAFWPANDVTLDPTKAIVFVHVEGTPVAVSSAAMHDPPIAWDGSAWAAGDTGVNVVFPNTDVSAGTSAVNFTSANGVGGGTFPVAAGTFTYVTLVAN